MENKKDFSIWFNNFNKKYTMKKLIVSSIFAAAAYTAGAAPLITIGDQLDLFFKGAFIGKWDSNVTYAHDSDNKIDDYAATFRLGAEADYGRNSKFKANVKFHEDITRYAEHKELNSNLAHVKANVAYVESNYKIAADFSFDQNFQNSADTVEFARGKLVRYNNITAGVNGSYDFTEKLFGEIGFRWYEIQYLGEWENVYSDQDIYSVPVSVLYRITEKISAGLTYQYRYTEFSGGPDYYALFYGDNRSDHFGGLTLRGELLPKLTSEIYAGVSYRDFTTPDRGDVDDTTFAIRGNFAYEVTEKLGVYVSGSRDFGSGASRQATIVSMGEIGVNYFFSEQVSAISSFTYSYTEYTSIFRNDDCYIGRVGIRYIPNKFLTFAANYRYLDNASNVTSATYSQHLVDISVSVKY